MRHQQRRTTPAQLFAAEVAEPRVMLTQIMVTTLADSAGLDVPDGEVSLREAITAANRDQAFGDAPAGSGKDRIVFDPSLNGGTIALDGLNLTVNSEIVIDGRGQDITVDGGGLSRVMNVVAVGSSRIQGLTLTGGSTGTGGGMRVSGDGTLRLDEMTLTGNEARNGGAGLWTDAARVGVYDSAVSMNDVTGRSQDGGGVAVRGGVVTLTNTSVAGNSVASSGLGGGVHVEGATVYLLGGSEVDGNTAGGGIAAEGASLVVVDGSAVTNNVSPFRGGGFLGAAETTFVARNADVSTNSASSAGGGLYSDGRLQLNDTTVAGNTAPGAAGIESTGTLIADGLTVSGNEAIASGGGLVVDGGFAFVTGSTFTGNVAESGSGGGLNVQQGRLTLRDSVVDGNEARSAGGILVGQRATARVGDTDIVNNTGEKTGGVLVNGRLYLRGGTVSGNVGGGDGGGLALLQMTTPKPLLSVSEGTVISGNSASVGGGVYAEGGRLQITDAVIGGDEEGDGNEAIEGGGLYVQGSGFGNEAAVQNTAVVGNSADFGGGVWIGPDAALRMRDSEVRDNTTAGTTGGSGGGFHTESGSLLVLDGVTVTGNVAQDASGGGEINGVLSLAGSTVTGNEALGFDGGGFVIRPDGRLVVSGDPSTISENTAAGEGGGLSVLGSAKLGDLTIMDNLAADGGGVFAFEDGTVELEDATITGNMPNDTAGPGTFV